MSAVRRVLMVAPHFPPDTTAGTHRVRLLAPHLPAFGWEPTVLTVDPRDYEGRLDPGLAELVPKTLRVERVRAWSAGTTRRLKLGDLGLRAYSGLRRRAAELLAAERYDALFITIYPTYPALLGPGLKKKFGVPFVLDYQDPWVGSWGKTVGGGAAGTADFKSRMSRRLATFLEPRAARAADALTAVSLRTLTEVQERNPSLANIPCTEIPLGGEAADFDAVRNDPRPNGCFDPHDGLFHLCYVGTLLPLGFETLRAVLQAVATLRTEQPALAAKLRLRFFGTSNQTDPHAPPRVLPVAGEFGVADLVTEFAPRIDYLDAVRVQTQASGLLMMGSSERHYTASKLYPGLLARRPILAAYHEASTVSAILAKVARPPAARLVTYGDDQRAERRAPELAAALAELLANPHYDPHAVDFAAAEEFSARTLAGRLAAVFDQAASAKGSTRP